MLRVSIIQKNKAKGIKTWYARIADRVRAREIPHIKDGKFTKFKREDLDAYMESRRVMPIEELRRAV